ncbi:MAG: hypothetical protein QOJ50_3348 [Cryptosporangiaceae bacterium]|nr:hypothetical protein [Cryptosporangiaceae bacterium]
MTRAPKAAAPSLLAACASVLVTGMGALVIRSRPRRGGVPA